MSKFSISKGAWIVVADGEKALILVNDGEKFSPRLSVHKKFERNIDSEIELLSDRPGRLSDGPSPHRSSVEQTDVSRAHKIGFAEKLSDFLNQRAYRSELEELVIVAPSVILHALRDDLNQAVRSHIVGELDKDLTNHPVERIAKLVLE